MLGCCSNWRVDMLSRFPILELRREAAINEVSTATTAGTVPMTGILQDNFGVKNQFYGGQSGLVGEYHRGPWSVDGFVKVALGNTMQTVNVGGAQTLFVNGVPAASANSGLLAQGTNSGHFTNSVFSVVPEVGINLGWQATQHIKLYAGYNFLYWTNVLRAGDQVDTDAQRAESAGPPALAAAAGESGSAGSALQ